MGTTERTSPLVLCMETSEEVAWRALCAGDQRVEISQGPTQDTIRSCTEWEARGQGPQQVAVE